MTTTSITRGAHTPDAPAVDVPALAGAADALLDALTEAGLDDPRWATAGPLVSAAAFCLREAFGFDVSGSCVSAPAVVREADLARATRPLLGSPTVVDAEAARQFARLAADATLAFG